MCGPQTSATRGSSVATPRFTRALATASASRATKAAPGAGDDAPRVLGEGHEPSPSTTATRARAVLGEHAVEVVARDERAAAPRTPERVGRRAQLGGSSTGSRSAAPDSSATAPVATARSRPSRASKTSRRATVCGAAPASTHARSASRASASAAPCVDGVRVDLGTHERQRRADRGQDLRVLGPHERRARAARATSRASAVPAPPSATTGTSGPKLVRARGVGDRVGDLVDGAVEQRARGLLGRRRRRRRAARTRAAPPPASPSRRRVGDEPERVRGAGRGEREARPSGVRTTRTPRVAGARGDELELGAASSLRRGEAGVRQAGDVGAARAGLLELAAAAAAPSTRRRRRRPTSRPSGSRSAGPSRAACAAPSGRP